jgi:hypothetical protein
MTPEIEKVNETDKDTGRQLLMRFDHFATSINHLKDHFGLLKDSISKVFSSTMKKLLEKCSLNHKITLLGIQAFKNSEILDFSPSLQLLSLEDLEKIDRHKEISPGEALSVIGKSCKIINSNKIRAGDPLSILTYNTFYDILKFSNIQENDFQTSQSFLVDFQENFTPKQKKCFFDISSTISKKLGISLNPLILNFSEQKEKSRNQVKEEEWVVRNKVSLKNEENHETAKEENKGSQAGERKDNGKKGDELENIVAEMFDRFYFELEENLNNKKVVRTEDLGKQLKDINDISSHLLYENLEYYSRIEEKYTGKLLLWKLISKTLHEIRIFNIEQRNVINSNIDRLKDNRRYRH